MDQPATRHVSGLSRARPARGTQPRPLTHSHENQIQASCFEPLTSGVGCYTALLWWQLWHRRSPCGEQSLETKRGTSVLRFSWTMPWEYRAQTHSKQRSGCTLSGDDGETDDRPAWTKTEAQDALQPVSCVHEVSLGRSRGSTWETPHGLQGRALCHMALYRSFPTHTDDWKNTRNKSDVQKPALHLLLSHTYVTCMKPSCMLGHREILAIHTR